MRSLFIFLASVLAALVLCLGSPAAAQPPPQVTGPITHVLTGLEQRAFLPADWTQEDFAAIAADEPAPDGHVWYVLQGNATNNGTEARSMLVYESEVMRRNEFHFVANVPVGGEPYYCEDSKRPFYTAAAIDVMRQACKTLAAR